MVGGGLYPRHQSHRNCGVFVLLSLDVAERFVALFLAGVGGLLAGGLTVLLRRAGPARRAFVCAPVAVAAGAAAWAWSAHPGMPLLAGGLVAIGAAACLLAGPARRRPATGWGMLGVLGLLTAVGAGEVYAAQERAAVEEGMRELGIGGPDLVFRVTPILVVTDRGTTFVMRELVPDGEEAGEEAGGDPAPAHRHEGPTNCHGWVFTGGRFWLDVRVVEQVLRDNGYEPVEVPRVGDLVIYRGPGGEIVHSAVVRFADPGRPVLVEGKWGGDEVHLHPVDQSMYGTDFTYYHSPRPGHTLTVIDTSDPHAGHAVGP